MANHKIIKLSLIFILFSTGCSNEKVLEKENNDIVNFPIDFYDIGNSERLILNANCCQKIAPTMHCRRDFICYAVFDICPELQPYSGGTSG